MHIVIAYKNRFTKCPLVETALKILLTFHQFLINHVLVIECLTLSFF